MPRKTTENIKEMLNKRERKNRDWKKHDDKKTQCFSCRARSADGRGEGSRVG